MTLDDDFDFDPTGDSPEFPTDDVLLVRHEDGSAAILPASLRRLDGEGRQVMAEMMRAAGEVHRAQAALSDLVGDARELGVPWAGIGWVTGLSGQGAQKRWG